MGNPYSVELAQGGRVTEAGQLTFTDPANQPGGAGATVRGPYSFTYATAGLAVGVTFYTPTVADILLDAWIEVDTAWDGTTPKGDIGFGGFDNNIAGFGLFAYAFGTGVGYVDMTQAASPGPGGGATAGLMLSGAGGLRGLDGAGEAFDLLHVPNTPPPTALTRLTPDNAFPTLPMKFRAASPLVVCVSQTGDTTGAAPGASQGAAKLYIITATPVAF